MTTKLIGIKEFRQNITTLWKGAQKEKIRYIVLYHSTPIFQVNPISKEDITLEKLAADVKKARIQAKRGETYTHEEILKELGF